MLGPLTYQAVLMMTRRRLERVRRQLDAKILSAQAVSETEVRVRFLAAEAEKLLSQSPHPTLELDPSSFSRWLSEGTSMHALLGSVGPEIPRFSAWLAPSSEWLVNTLHRGQADPDRQRVFARSTDLALTFWDKVDALIGVEQGLTNATRAAARKRMGAYVLGHLCHVAADLESAPFLTDVTAHLGAGGTRRQSFQEVADAIDEAVARKVFQRDEARGREWSSLWIEPALIPGHFFEAYRSALEEVYGPGARRSRAGATFADEGFFPPGSRAFEQTMLDNAPPVLSNQLIREGYSTYRAVFERDWAWTYGDWIGATLWMFLIPFLTYPLALVLPEGSRVLRDDLPPGEPPVDTERGWFEVLTFPLAVGSLVPLTYNICLGAGTYMGVGLEVGLGLGFSIGALVLAIIFFATLKVDDLPAGFRWPVLFVLPLGLLLAHLIVVFARGRGEEPRRIQLGLGSTLPLFNALFFVGAYAAFLRFGVYAIRDAVAEREDSDKSEAAGLFLLTALGWGGILALIWVLLPLILPRRNPRRPFVTGRRHFLGLFDDATLFVDPSLEDPTLADRHFPTRRRPLIKIWWTDNTDQLFVRSRRDLLELSFTGQEADPVQRVMAPLAPMTAGEFATFLTRSVRDGSNNFSSRLEARRADDDPLDYRLGPGAVFADFGDDRDDLGSHDQEAAKFRQVPATEAEALVLFHAPYEHRKVTFGQGGPRVDLDRATADGAGTIGPGAGAAEVVGAGGSRFVSFFRPGDLIETRNLATAEARVVVSIQDDAHLTVNVQFSAAVVATTDYRRRVVRRDLDVLGSGTIAPSGVDFRQIAGTGTTFASFLMPGDVVRALPVDGGTPEERTVRTVISDTGLELEQAFSRSVWRPDGRAPNRPATFKRLGTLDADGFQYVPDDPTALLSGTSIMDRAADVASILCLGAASHVIPDAELEAKTTGALEERHPKIDKVYQVFRNWNLDLRRVNEWKMLISGDATSEKRGAPGDPDPLQPETPLPDPTDLRGHEGEPTANRLGWVGTLTRWLDAARRPGVDMTEEQPFRPGDPTKLELSRAMAYLFDMPDPGP